MAVHAGHTTGEQVAARLGIDLSLATYTDIFVVTHLSSRIADKKTLFLFFVHDSIFTLTVLDAFVKFRVVRNCLRGSVLTQKLIRRPAQPLAKKIAN